MGSLRKDTDVVSDSEEEDQQTQVEKTGEFWALGSGDGTWQNLCDTIKSRMSNLYKSNQMSDVLLLAVDENWWFGETVKDFPVSNNAYWVYVTVISVCTHTFLFLSLILAEILLHTLTSAHLLPMLTNYSLICCFLLNFWEVSFLIDL